MNDASNIGSAGRATMSYLSRLWRLVDALFRGHISFRSFRLGLWPRTKMLALIGGGMWFCDERDEREFFHPAAVQAGSAGRSGPARKRLEVLTDRFVQKVTSRPPDFIIGGDDPYLLRWWVIPRNRLFNVYLHRFMRSDDDRALHDHPWSNLSVLLRGGYIEHTQVRGVPRQRVLRAGSWRLRALGSMSHRIDLIDGEPAWTLFVTGPRYREWGFLCPKGWVHWRRFTNDGDGGATVGRGCDQ